MRKCAKEGIFLRVLLVFVVASALPAYSQLTFATAIDLAVENSLKVKSAREDVKKAAAALGVTKDLFIPSVVMGGGLGAAYGITLTVPTIFTINAQSLVYSAQQLFYVRAARSDLRSAQLALEDARDQAMEDAAVTYLSVEHAEKSVAAITQQHEFAARLVSIVEDRVKGNLDSELELLKARRTEIQLRLQKMRVEDDAAALRDHLAQLTGRPAEAMSIVPESVPAMAATERGAPMPAEFVASPGLRSAEASAQGRRERARGDSIYTWRPQVSFAAQYGRISPYENVGNFYNLHGNYNTASVGIQIQFPLLDRVRAAAAAKSTADARRSENELQGLRFDEERGRKKLLRSVPELAANAELAELQQQIAETELGSTLAQMKQSSGGPVVTPKEEMNARMEERQRYLEVLDARLELAKAQIALMRQTGALEKWLRSAPSQAAP